MRSGVASRTPSVALVGTRGVPARYGGFETAVEEVGRRLVARGHRVVVYRRADDHDDPGPSHLGMELVTLPAVRRRSLETLSHTGLAVLHLLRHRTDAVVLFNAANAPWLPLLRLARLPVATHVDGLEWLRAKWGPVGRRYYRWAETLAVRLSDAIVADSAGIEAYYKESFGVASRLIAYGAPVTTPGTNRLAELGLTSGQFHLVVARLEPENHVDMIVSGFRSARTRHPLVVVGSAPYAADYTKRVHSEAAGDPRIQFLGSVWDQEVLDQLYAGALTYLHGHSVGGTNPSLLRAAGAGTATIAYDVVFNHDVLAGAGRYFRSAEEVRSEVELAETDPEATAERGRAAARRASAYDWDDVAHAYRELVVDLARGRCGRSRPHRRRVSSIGSTRG